jgi:hypothetical protein
MHDVERRNTGLSKVYIATLAAMDGSRAQSRTFVFGLATLTIAALALAPGALAQSAGDDQYSDPLAGGGEQQQEPASPGGDDRPSPEPTPAPTPAAPSGADAPASSSGTAGADTTATTPLTGESLPRTGAEPVPTVATGALLLLAGAALRRQVLRHAPG